MNPSIPSAVEGRPSSEAEKGLGSARPSVPRLRSGWTDSALGALTIDGGLFVNPNPNTVLLNLAGLSVTLNEQRQVLTGLSDIFRETNAIHIALDNYSLAGSLVTGDIIIGHSQAAITGYLPAAVGAVPEPATWGMLIVGFGLVGRGDAPPGDSDVGRRLTGAGEGATLPPFPHLP